MTDMQDEAGERCRHGIKGRCMVCENDRLTEELTDLRDRIRAQGWWPSGIGLPGATAEAMRELLGG